MSQDSDDNISNSVKFKNQTSNETKSFKSDKVIKTLNLLGSKKFDLDHNERFKHSSFDLQTNNTGISQTGLNLGEVKTSLLKENNIKEVLTNVQKTEVIIVLIRH